MRRLVLVIGMGLFLACAAVAGAASPSVTTGGASSVKKTTATLNAAINPGGQRTVYYFQYGPTSAYGAQTVTKSAGSGTKSVSVKTGISKLTPGTTYHYRVVAANSQGSTVGKDRHFKTAGVAPAPPAVFTGGTFHRTLSGAQLTGVVASVRSAATYRFQFGLTSAYGVETTAFAVSARPFPQPVSFTLTGLQPHQIYHYRIVATNKDGTAAGADQIFITGRRHPGTLTRNTHRRHLSGRLWRLTTSGTLHAQKSLVPFGACRGTVRVRFLRGHRVVRSVRSPLGGDCRYSASAVIRAGRGGSRIRVAPLFRGNALLTPRSGRLQVVHIG